VIEAEDVLALVRNQLPIKVTGGVKGDLAKKGSANLNRTRRDERKERIREARRIKDT